ncbi:MAG: hypothetical protein A2Y81_06565 [Nitrospirae bacterium RBG_13_43_8]|nr:MAG: hypothetical protein A2Y81_06565 [Nitrospirae bacterium RBG_13_43_8]
MACDVKGIYEMGNRVLSRLGKGVQAGMDCYLGQYEDKQILIQCDGYDSYSFRVYEKVGDRQNIVLETHLTSNRNIASKDELLRDMLHHRTCDGDCPGFRRKTHKRAYEIYLQREGKDGNELDDWLKAESETLGELELKFSGDWEVATILPQDPHPIYGKTWGPYPCVILKRGEWMYHLESLASNL